MVDSNIIRELLRSNNGTLEYILPTIQELKNISGAINVIIPTYKRTKGNALFQKDHNSGRTVLLFSQTVHKMNNEKKHISNLP